MKCIWHGITITNSPFTQSTLKLTLSLVSSIHLSMHMYTNSYELHLQLSVKRRKKKNKLEAELHGYLFNLIHPTLIGFYSELIDRVVVIFSVCLFCKSVCCLLFLLLFGISLSLYFISCF